MTTLTPMRTKIALLIPWGGGDPLHPTQEMETISRFAKEVADGLDAEGINMEGPPVPKGAARIGTMTSWGKPPWTGDTPAVVYVNAYDEEQRVREALARVLAGTPVGINVALVGQEADDHYRKEVR